MSTIVQGGAAATAVAFLHSALSNMIPYAIIAVPLVVLDLLWGIRAAKYRKERVTFSRAFRRTMSKVADYACWIIIAGSISLAFKTKWLEWAIIGAVVFNEITSIVGNYFETKGIQLSMVDLFRWLFRAGAGKVGVELDKEDAENIIKPRREQPRDLKSGRFIKKEDNV